MSTFISIALAAELMSGHTDGRTQLEDRCAIQTIAYEAGAESYKGKRAVAEIILERMKDSRWGGSECSVATKFTTLSSGRVIYQFSYITAIKLGKMVEIKEDSKAWRESAQVWMNYKYHYSKSDYILPAGTDHYLNYNYLNSVGKLPNWYSDDLVTAEIGNHKFLNVEW